MKSRTNSEDELQLDESLKRTLKDYRSCVHAWSDAEYSRPHQPVRVYGTNWRLVVGWGCLLGILSLGGGVYERQYLKERAKTAAAEAARQQMLETEQRKAGEDLFAKIDSDVSREVPSAMEPLAKMMVEDSTE